MRSAFILVIIALGCTLCQGYVASPIVGYQQGLTLQMSPPSNGGQCLVYGVPTPTGYADQAQSPVFLDTPQNTGSHVLQFLFDQSKYALSPFLAPGQTTLQIDASDANNPLITFDATNSPQGQSGAITVYLSDKSSGASLCYSQIQFTVDQPLSCLPSYGGVYPNANSPAPPTTGQFVIPSGSVYAPTFVQQTIIEQFVTINNININQVIVNVNQITNTNVINNIVVNPPSPAPVNCTKTPKDPACLSPRPAPSPTHVPPKPAPTPTPGPTPPAPSPTIHPHLPPPVPSPPTAQPTPMPTTATPPSQPTVVPPSQPTPAVPPFNPTPVASTTPTVSPPSSPVPSSTIYSQTPPAPTVTASASQTPVGTTQPLTVYTYPPTESQTQTQSQTNSRASPPYSFSQSFGRRL